MEVNRKLLLDTFQDYLLDSYQSYCETQQLPMTTKGFLIYLIDRDLIPFVKIKRFTLLKVFDEELVNCNHHKTNTVKRLALRFNISERGVWNVLKK